MSDAIFSQHTYLKLNFINLCLLKRDKTSRCAIYTIRMTYIYQVVVHVHQDCYTNIKIRHNYKCQRSYLHVKRYYTYIKII